MNILTKDTGCKMNFLKATIRKIQHQKLYTYPRYKFKIEKLYSKKKKKAF